MPDTLSPPKGIVCPKCGGKKLPARYTRRKGSTLKRMRKCRNCGHNLYTTETVSSNQS